MNTKDTSYNKCTTQNTARYAKTINYCAKNEIGLQNFTNYTKFKDENIFWRIL